MPCLYELSGHNFNVRYYHIFCNTQPVYFKPFPYSKIINHKSQIFAPAFSEGLMML